MEKSQVRSDFDEAYLVHLISWLRNNAQRQLRLRPDEDPTERERYGLTKTALAYAFNTTIPIIERYLYADPNRGTPTGNSLVKQSIKFAPVAKFLLDQHNIADLPAPVRTSMSRIYIDRSSDGLGPIRNRDAIEFNSMAPASGHIDLSPMYGLQVMVRVSTESIPTPEIGAETKVTGTAISLLNVIPPVIQEGVNHTLFKIYHRGLVSVGTDIIEGAVFSQENSIYFQGVGDSSQSPFFAWVRPPKAPYSTYRRDLSVYLHGVMAGISSTGYNFAGVFEMFPLPHGLIDQESTGDQENPSFKEMYKKGVEATGVQTLEETVAKLQELGIPIIERDLTDILNNMMQTRSRGRHLYIS